MQETTSTTTTTNHLKLMERISEIQNSLSFGWIVRLININRPSDVIRSNDKSEWQSTHGTSALPIAYTNIPSWYSIANWRNHCAVVDHIMRCDCESLVVKAKKRRLIGQVVLQCNTRMLRSRVPLNGQMSWQSPPSNVVSPSMTFTLRKQKFITFNHFQFIIICIIAHPTSGRMVARSLGRSSADLFR